MPKLKADTAILRVIDKKSIKDGAIFRMIRENCIEWGITGEECERAIQTLLDKQIIEEPTVGYFKRCDKCPEKN